MSSVVTEFVSAVTTADNFLFSWTASGRRIGSWILPATAVMLSAHSWTIAVLDTACFVTAWNLKTRSLLVPRTPCPCDTVRVSVSDSVVIHTRSNAFYFDPHLNVFAMYSNLDSFSEHALAQASLSMLENMLDKGYTRNLVLVYAARLAAMEHTRARINEFVEGLIESNSEFVKEVLKVLGANRALQDLVGVWWERINEV